MNAQLFPNSRFRRLSSVLLAAAAISVFVFFQTAAAQQPQLSLADFLIGLRSKKVTLPERNKLLTEAAKARGVTFELTPEIEKELENTGADKDLIDAIRSKATVVKIAATVQPKNEPKVDPVPVSTPSPPDHAFYQKRAGTFMAKGEFDSAITDLNKAVEMNATDASDYASRGLAYYNKKSFDLAIADYTKSIELKPNESMSYVNRGFAFEKSGDSEKALADFQKAFDLDAKNETASLNLKRLKDDKAQRIAKEQAAQKPVEVPKVAPSVPDAIALGQLSTGQATKMVMPVYSDVARKANIEGKVVVDVTLDRDGNVTSAKAENGHPFLRQAAEDAAKRSKFKPAMFGDVPVKATGFIVYNFTRNGGQE